LDEVDAWTNREVLRSVLNAGFRNGATVPRMREQGATFEVEKFPVYAPRALAGIGLRVLDQTTLDRAFRIQMMRQKPEERREPFLRAIKPKALALKTEIAKWAEEHAAPIVERYDSAFPYLGHFRDRTIDVTQPLAAIVEVAYRDAPEPKASLADLVQGVAITRQDQQCLVEEHRILAELTRLARPEGVLTGTASELAGLCSEKPSEYAVSATLRRYGFETKSVRKDGSPKYRYTVEYEKLADFCARYGVLTEDQEEVYRAEVSSV
jgi:hypothetical protein